MRTQNLFFALALLLSHTNAMKLNTLAVNQLNSTSNMTKMPDTSGTTGDAI